LALLAAMGDSLIGQFVEPAKEGETRGLALEFLRWHFPFVRIERFGIDIGAENEIRQGKAKKAGDRFIAADVGVVAQVKGIGFAPETSGARLADEAVPGGLREVFHRMKKFVKGD